MAKPVLSSQAPGGHVGLITPIGIGKLPQLNYENRYIVGFMQFCEIIFTLHHRFFFLSAADSRRKDLRTIVALIIIVPFNHISTPIPNIPLDRLQFTFWPHPEPLIPHRTRGIPLPGKPKPKQIAKKAPKQEWNGKSFFVLPWWRTVNGGSNVKSVWYFLFQKQVFVPVTHCHRNEDKYKFEWKVRDKMLDVDSVERQTFRPSILFIVEWIVYRFVWHGPASN